MMFLKVQINTLKSFKSETIHFRFLIKYAFILRTKSLLEDVCLSFRKNNKKFTLEAVYLSYRKNIKVLK
jgi:hypothetical protein